MSEMIERLNAALEGRYEIERELGEGGMATVYLARDLRHERKVALKVLRPELAAVVGAERFLAEIKTTANLQHPHILPLFDSGEADSFLFYVMPWVEGESLRDRLHRERQLPVEEAVTLASKVASALQYAHEQEIIHRDIKPANILMSRGEPLVADFGIALALTEAGGGRITETGLSLGTPHYMSPEQAAGERSLDVRSDVYALGSVLYEMLTGEPPYGGPNAQAVLARILTEQPRRVTDIRRTVPPNVEAAVAKALEKLPADRFASAGEFQKALQDPAFRHVSAAPTPLAPTPLPVATPRSGAGSGPLGRLAPWLAAAVFAALAIYGWSRTPVAPNAPVTRMAIPHSGAGFGRTVAISQDGSLMAWTGPSDEGDSQIFLRRSGDPEARPVPGTEGAVNPSFSPDGQWISYLDVTSGSVRKVAVAGGPPLTLVSGGAFPTQWAADGSILLGMNGGIARIPSSGGTPEVLLEAGDSVRYGRPWMLPDDRGVLLEIHAGGPEAIGVLDLESGQVRTLVQDGVAPRYAASGHLVFAHRGNVLFAAPFDLKTLEIEGTPAPVLEGVTVFGGGAAQFDVSRSGTAIYVGGGSDTGGGSRLLMVDMEGAVDTLPLERARYGTPRFSPDGGRIAFNNGADIFVYDLTLGTTTRLTFEGLNLYPVWSPDGAYIAFGSERDGTRQSDAFRKKVDGSADAEMIASMEEELYPQSWSSDGGRLVTRYNDPDRSLDLLLATFDENGQARVTPYLTADWEEKKARISPDGRWVAYVSDEAKQDEVYIRAFPEPRGKWQVSQGGGTDPVWSPDGKRIYYRSGGSVIAADVATRPTFTVTGRSVLFGDDFDDSRRETSYDIAPDGNHFVFLEQVAAAGQSNLIITVNWFRELRERLGEAKQP